MNLKRQARNMKRKKQAERVDNNNLYEKSVQNVGAELEFIDKVYADHFNGNQPSILREDFSGTSALCCEWVKAGKDRQAIGVDLDEDVLAWAEIHNISKLDSKQRQRVELIHKDVLTVKTSKVDVIGAFNFSYWVFHKREELKAYFKNCLQGLNRDGLMFLDAFGGSDAYVVQKERTKYRTFTYVWHQAYFEPITARYRCHIGFEFPDGSKIPQAFTYDWRLWTLPEIKEVLLEAGFREVTIYWEEEDEDGDGTGNYLPETKGTNDAAWVVYLVAKK
jgi:SAM-dependent methyltransferase